MSIDPRQLFFHLRKMIRNDHFVLSVLAVVMGLVVGCGVVVFRLIINAIHQLFYGASEANLATVVAGLPWWHVLAATTVGGLLMAIWHRYFMPGGRPQGIANVIEATVTRGGRLDLRTGFAAILGSALSIGVGAPVGREGPAVHWGASVCAWMAEKLHFGRALTRTLLGCGAAAAVAASFNAPIAGALFAHEVVVGHFAMSALAPVVISSVTATLVSRAVFGDFPAFTLPHMELTSVLEFPAFAGLGICAAIASMAFMSAIFYGDDLARRIRIPMFWRPVTAGFGVGLIALFLPQILAVGYEVTDSALNASLPFLLLLALVVAKIVGSGLALGFGSFAGGVFSPSLTVGALLGSAFGIAATSVFPDLSSGPGAYAVVGMGAVAAAVMGAPVSTVLIVFELTRDTALTVGVMVAVVVATLLTQQIAKRSSFFHWQLERRGLNLRGGHDMGVMSQVTVADVLQKDCPMVPVEASIREVREALMRVPYGELFVVANDGTLFGTIMLSDLGDEAFDHDLDALLNAADVARRRPPVLELADTLEKAIKYMISTGEEHMAVVEHDETMRLVGCVHESDILLEYNRQIMRMRAEERGDVRDDAAPF